jgi:hypothetical protein
VAAYVVAAVACTIGFDVMEPTGRYLGSMHAQINGAAVALLRGLGLTLVGISLPLNLYLRMRR